MSAENPASVDRALRPVAVKKVGDPVVGFGGILVDSGCRLMQGGIGSASRGSPEFDVDELTLSFRHGSLAPAGFHGFTVTAQAKW